jgi:hypothetical protein
LKRFLYGEFLTMIQMRTWPLLVVILAIQVVRIPTSADATENEIAVGLVREKPLSGPFVKTEQGYMVSYQLTIPDLKIAIDMVPIPGGTFLMGSAETDPEGRNDEGPQVNQYSTDGYKRTQQRLDEGENVTAVSSYRQPTTVTGRIARGGGYLDIADGCRSANRLAHDEDEWKEEDPDLPKSTHWLASSVFTHVGFRITRPLNLMPQEKVGELGIWDTQVEQLASDVNVRIEEGRGAIGLVDAKLPGLLRKYREDREAHFKKQQQQRLRDQNKGNR